jgi:hypothetical protein
MLQRIPNALLKVVPVPSPGVGWKQVELNFKQASKRLADPPRKESTHRGAVRSTLAAEERAVANTPVIPVDARRERQHKPQHGYRIHRTVREGQRVVPRRRAHVRFHGGVVELLAALAGAAAGAATGLTEPESRFL